MSLKSKAILTAAFLSATLAAGIASATTYTVGTGATYRPFEYETPSKELTGFDVDLMKEIAKAGDFDVKFINTAWSAIFAGLNNGDLDIIMSGITITPKRQETIDFSRPYFLAHQLILTNSDLKITSLKDLKGKLIAVVAASAGDVAASAEFGKASLNIRRFDNTPLALEELANGGVDAMIGDVGVLQWYVKQNPSKNFNQCRDPNFAEQYFGIGIRKGNKQVLDDVNRGLEKAISSGAYDAVYRKWFGAEAPKLP